MRTLFLLLCAITASLCENPSEIDINDLFPVFKEPDDDDKSPGDTFSNFTIDIEKLDINKFSRQMTADLMKKTKEEEDALAKDPRRSNMVYMYDDGKFVYMKASEIISKQKAVDLILQMVYMSRRTMKQLEGDKYFNTKDTGFRVGFVFNKLRILLTRMTDYLAIMHKHKMRWPSVIKHINLHQKMVRIHVDFQYYYWALTRLDGKYREALGPKHVPKLPKRDLLTGGISPEVRYSFLPNMTYSNELPHNGPWNA